MKGITSLTIVSQVYDNLNKLAKFQVLVIEHRINTLLTFPLLLRNNVVRISEEAKVLALRSGSWMKRIVLITTNVVSILRIAYTKRNEIIVHLKFKNEHFHEQK